MVGEVSGGPSKKPRIENIIDLAENDDLKEQVRKLEEKNEQLNRSLKAVQVEKKEVDEAMEELRGMVECPVCLLVPRQVGPVPVCSNGHFVCRTCRNRIRQDALDTWIDQKPKCPSCMVDLGNATSLLASRLVERMKHECGQDGCEEMIPFPQLEKHQMVCLFRKVLCPGSTCELEIEFNKVEEHTKSCASIWKQILENDCTYMQYLTRPQKDNNGTLLRWPTNVHRAHGKEFFIKTKRENRIHIFETIMLGTEEECKNYISSITILDKDFKSFTTFTCRPRPISMEKWGDMGLMLSEKALARNWTAKNERYEYQIRVSILKV